MNFVASLNALNSVPVALILIVIGCGYSVICVKNNISADMAHGIIAAGITVLTTSAAKAKEPQSQTPTQPGETSNPATPDSAN